MLTQVASMNSSDIWRPGLVQSVWKQGSALTPNPRLRKCPLVTADDNHMKTQHSAFISPSLPAGSLCRECGVCACVNMNNTSNAHSAGFGVSNCSVMTVGNGLRLGVGKKVWMKKIHMKLISSFLFQLKCSVSTFVPHAGCDEVGRFPGSQFYCKRFCIFLFVKERFFYVWYGLMSNGVADVVQVCWLAVWCSNRRPGKKLVFFCFFLQSVVFSFVCLPIA